MGHYDQGLSGAQWFLIWAGNVIVLWLVLYTAVLQGVSTALKHRDLGKAPDQPIRRDDVVGEGRGL